MVWLASAAPPSRSTSVGCTVISDFVSFAQTKPDVFGGPPLTMPMTQSEFEQRKLQLPNTPEYRAAADLLSRSIVEKPIDPLIACPELSNELDRVGIAHGAAAVDAALNYASAKASSPDRPLYVLAIRLPLVSADGNFAIVDMTTSSAVYKSGDTLLMRKGADGRWKEAAKLRSWVS